MGYAQDLLDGFDLLYKRSEGVLKVSEEMGDFFKQLSGVEQDYSLRMSKLSKTGQKRLLSDKYLDGSTKEAWKIILAELEAIGNLHGNLSNQIKDLGTNLDKYVGEKEKLRKKLVTDGRKLTADWKTQQDTLASSKSKYHRLCKEAENAQNALGKGQADPKVKQNKVQELSQKSQQAAEKASQADSEYRDMLAQTNNKQNEYYTRDQPNLLNEFQQFEEDRINFVKDSMAKLSAHMHELPPAIERSAQAITQASDQVDKEADTRGFVAENKTNVTPPPPIEYVPYEGDLSGGGQPIKFKPTSQQPKEWGITAKDQGLTQEQKRAKVEQQLIEVKAALKSETQAKKGVEKLVQFYANDPVAQKKAEVELNEADRKVKMLTEAKRVIIAQINENGGNAYDSDAEPEYSGDSSQDYAQQEYTQQEYAQTSQIRVRGLYDYDATADTELSFREGDIMTITEQDESGWWFAEIDGRSGFIPQNYVEVVYDQ